MKKMADSFGEDVVADAFDQAIVLVKQAYKADPQIFEKKLRELNKICPEPLDISTIDMIAAAAAEQALAAFFSNIELMPFVKLVLVNEDDTEYNLSDTIDTPFLSFFNSDGWLGKYANFGALARVWQSSIE